MRKGQRVGLVALALLLLGGGLSLALLPGDSRRPTDAGEPPATAPTADAPRLAAQPTAAPPPQDTSPATVTDSVPGSAIESAACSVHGVVRRGSEPVAATIEVRRAVNLSGPEAVTAPTMIASAMALPDSSPVVMTTTTGSDGRYEIAGLSPAIYHLGVREPDGALTTVRVMLFAHGDRRRADVVLATGSATLRGRVVHADGRNATGWVSAWDDEQHEHPDSGVMTHAAVGPDGRFEVRDLRPGPVSVRVAHTSGLVVTRDRAVTVPYPGEWTVVVDERVTTLVCRAVAAEDGTPIPATRWATWTHDGADHVMASGGVDAEGRFALPTIDSSPPQAPFVCVSAPGRLTLYPSRASSETMVLRRPVTFELVKAARIAGRVHEATSRRPLAGARVLVVGDGDANAAMSDAEGRWIVGEQPEGEALVFVAGGGWMSVDPVGGLRAAVEASVTRAVAGETTVRDLEVWPTPLLEGRVLDERGVPVPHASVRAECAKNQTPELWRAFLELADATRRAAADGKARRALDSKAYRFQMTSALEYDVTADEAGRYRLDGLLPGITYDVEATTSGARTRDPANLRLDHGERRTLDLTVLPRDD